MATNETAKAPALPEPMVRTRRHGPPTVIHAALLRSGTMTMARAYDILGLRAHHALDIPLQALGDGGWDVWDTLEKAAEATWPGVNGSPNARKLTRKDWDEAYGAFDVVTDMGALYADQLVEVYPNAKVVMVERDFEEWWPSFRTGVLERVFSPVTPFLRPLEVLSGIRCISASAKSLKGFLNTRGGVKQMAINARHVHRAYYGRLRELVPAERRLEYQLDMGWEPLCEFLGVEVPNVPFPRWNSKEQHELLIARNNKRYMYALLVGLQPWILLAFVIGGLAVWLGGYLTLQE